MKVYLLIGYVDYEGYDMPLGVFETEAEALEALARTKGVFDSLDVYPYEVGHLFEPYDASVKSIAKKGREGWDAV